MTSTSSFTPRRAPGRVSALSPLWRMAALALCASAAQAATLQVTVLDKDGKPAADAVVVVTPAVAGKPKSRPPLSATINQEKMQFWPAVTVVGVGATVRFVNSDPWNHHVRMGVPGAPLAEVSAASQGNALYLKGKVEGKPASSADLVMDQVGATGASLVGCFIHGSMRGHVYVADSAWTVKTGDDGTVTFDDLPEGPASLKVWHPAQLVDKPTQPITIGAAPGKSEVRLDVTPRKRRVAAPAELVGY